MTKKDNFELGNCTCNFLIKPCVNFEALWKLVCEDGRIKHKEDCFIRKFSETTTHEIIHAEIFEILLSLFTQKEEEIVNKMAEYK